jgi:hypothetical protein
LASALEGLHFILCLYFLYVFFLGARFFRFHNAYVDRVWLACGAFALGGATALFGSRLLFGGVYNAFYFSGPLMWICPLCAPPHIAGHIWTPADWFVHAAFLPPIILLAAYFVPATRAANATSRASTLAARRAVTYGGLSTFNRPRRIAWLQPN